MNAEVIKVCGMREAENIRAVEALGIDWMGFIFWKASRRYVGDRPSYLPTVDDIRLQVSTFGLDVIQLHGHETPAFVQQLREALPLTIVKALNVSTPDDLRQAEPYEGIADALLFDTRTPLPGGSGQQFDWSILADYRGKTPFLLSGGIGPGDADRLRQFHHPRCMGIDLNSRFETEPAVKDVEALAQFLRTLRPSPSNPAPFPR